MCRPRRRQLSESILHPIYPLDFCAAPCTAKSQCFNAYTSVAGTYCNGNLDNPIDRRPRRRKGAAQESTAGAMTPKSIRPPPYQRTVESLRLEDIEEIGAAQLRVKSARLQLMLAMSRRT